MNTQICAAPDCDRPVRCKGFCQKHYYRWRKYGDPEKVAAFGVYERPAATTRFWRFVDKSGGDNACWLWLGADNGKGYGIFSVEGSPVYAHRFAYAEAHGPIPNGIEIDHVRDRGCTHRNCVNPAHLEAVTHRINVLRSENFAAQYAKQTHCKHGHELTEANTYLWRGTRLCRECRRRIHRVWGHAQSTMPYTGDRTHCPQGHPYDSQNTKTYQGRRYCRACQRERGRKQQPIKV